MEGGMQMLDSVDLRSIVALVSVLSLTPGCGGGQPGPSSPAASLPSAGTSAIAPSEASVPPDRPVAAAPTAPKSWSALGHEERLALMKGQVLPKMKAAFQAQDPKAFAEFSCATCHGEGVKTGNFEMPNAKLPRLNAKDDFKKDAAKHPSMMKFMEQTVEPTMAGLLGLPEWSQTNPSGFGCENCHSVEK
jgi:hypothetical protein